MRLTGHEQCCAGYCCQLAVPGTTIHANVSRFYQSENHSGQAPIAVPSSVRGKSIRVSRTNNSRALPPAGTPRCFYAAFGSAQRRLRPARTGTLHHPHAFGEPDRRGIALGVVCAALRLGGSARCVSRFVSRGCGTHMDIVTSPRQTQAPSGQPTESRARLTN